MKSNNEHLPDWALDAVSQLPALVPIKQAAGLLSVSVRTTRRWIRSERLLALRTSLSGSGRVLIPRLEIARFLVLLSGDDLRS
jgi:excisionase family DNA binding protein